MEPSSSIISVNDPEPSDILQCPDNINDISTTRVLNIKIKKLWETPDSELTDDEKLLYYWHKQLQHTPKKYIRRLIKVVAL